MPTHPCFAVSTASLIPSAFIDTAHWLMLRAEGAKESGLEDPVLLGRFQLLASHPGSPFLKKVAMLKWHKAMISPLDHASCCGVGRGRDPSTTVNVARVAAAAVKIRGWGDILRKVGGVGEIVRLRWMENAADGAVSKG